MTEPEPTATTNPAEIEALITRLKLSNLSASDALLAERLFRLLLTLIHLVEKKNASISRLKRLLFGPSSDTRSSPPAKSPTQQQGAAAGSTPSSADDSSPGSVAAIVIRV